MGLLAVLLAGCSTGTSQNRKVYDRYAALVAERKREHQTESVSSVSASREISSSGKETASLNRRPIKTSAPSGKPVAKKVAAKESDSFPTSVAVEKKAPVKTPAAETPAPELVKAEPVPAPPPVQVIAPEPVKVPEPAPVSPAPASAPASTPPASDLAGGYSLKAGDGIQITLRGIPAPEAIEDIIDETGRIALPLINEVQAAGLTASELERSIRQAYIDQDIYRNISVNVVVPTRYYYVQGEVRGPGRFQIVSATRVSQAIAGCGGYTEYASGKVTVKRDGKIFKVIRNARRLDRTPQDDILLNPDDIVIVGRSLW